MGHCLKRLKAIKSWVVGAKIFTDKRGKMSIDVIPDKKKRWKAHPTE